MPLVDELREACAWIAGRAASVSIDEQALASYDVPPSEPPPPGAGDPAYVLQLDAINFGSGWFPTLRKRPGMSGYRTIEAGLREHGPWPVDALVTIDAQTVANALGQDLEHELMALFAASLRDLGTHVRDDHGGDFAAVVTATAVELVERLANWRCFEDVSVYDGRRVPFLKRAQIAAADLGGFPDLHRLTMFADNLVPHVLRVDGVLRHELPETLEHGSPEEVELRACAVHAVELLAARLGRSAADIDNALWNKGAQPRYKALPRHRTRCTAY